MLHSRAHFWSLRLATQPSAAVHFRRDLVVLTDLVLRMASRGARSGRAACAIDN